MTKRFARLLAAAALGFTAPFAAGAAGSAPQATQTSTNDSKVTIPVEGLTCATCSITVRRALKKMDGIKNIEPGPHENEAVITYDAAKVKPEQMVEAIGKVGFKAGTPVNG